jgi:hypothetical protein
MLDLLRQHEADMSAALSGDDPERDVSILQKIKPSSKISPQLAPAIYRNNTRGARVSTLEQTYPACTRILGKAVFRSIAIENE